MLSNIMKFFTDDPNYAGKDIEKQCGGIYPLQSVFVRKVKILRAPKFDVSKLMEVHGDYAEEVRDMHTAAVTVHLCAFLEAC